MSVFSTALKGVVAAAALLAIGQAQAVTSPGSGARLVGIGSSTAPIIGQQSSFLVNVAGISSVAAAGTAGNTVLSFNVGAGSSVTGIGWDVNNTAFTPSWLSEMVVRFTNTDGSGGVDLTVGNGDDFAGTAAYNSGGVLDLIGLGLSFTANADGLVRFEFFESFNDAGVTPDGTWNSGALTLQVVAIPEPATYALMAMGLFAVGAAARRRKL